VNAEMALQPTHLLELALQDDICGLIAALKASLSRGGFAAVRRDLAEASSSARENHSFGSFVLRALLALPSGPERPQALAALFADLGPSPAEAALVSASGDSAAPLAQAAACELARPGGDAKAAVRVLHAWGVRDADVLKSETRDALAAAVLDPVRHAGASLSVAAWILTAFPALLGSDEAWEVLQAVDNGNQDDVAEKLAKSLGRELQVKMVRRRQHLDRLRPAARAVNSLGLQAEFPDAEFEWKSHALRSSIRHKSREAVIGLAFGEPRLRSDCVAGLLELDDPVLAVELAECWAVPLGSEVASAAAAARAAAEASHLPLPENVRMHIIDAEASVSAMRDVLLQAKAVGFDAEWVPSQGSPPALLQLATFEAAYLVDLLALSSSAVLGEALGAIMSARNVTKVSFEGAKDLGRIAAAMPALSACKRVAPLVDLHDLAAGRRAEEEGTSKKRAKEGLNLKSLVEKYLGLPLDKTMQMSDWSRRPLSAAQAQYAALDAWVVLQVYELLSVAAPP